MSHFVCSRCGAFIADDDTSDSQFQENYRRHQQTCKPKQVGKSAESSETKHGKRPGRKGIRLPEPMVEEVDRLIEAHPEMAYTRQQFIETAVREKIERVKLLNRPRGS